MPWPQICPDLARTPSVNTLCGELSLMNIRDRCGIDKKATLCLIVVVMFATLDPAVTAQEIAQSGLPPGWITPTTPGIVQEPTVLRKLAGASDNNVGEEPKDGLYAEFGNMITGEGWISAGPGYRMWGWTCSARSRLPKASHRR